MTSDARIRVLVVDDSAFARKVLREALSAHPRLLVVGTARDGLEALERVAELRPDVMTLDLVMPNLDGLGVLRALPPLGAPRVVIVSVSDQDSELGIDALSSGAVDLVQKPTALATDRLFELSEELCQKVIMAASAVLREAATSPTPLLASALVPRPSGRVKVVVIGTSTGGPQALSRLIPAFPPDFPVPVVVALHIPAGYTEALSRRLGEASRLRVVEAGFADVPLEAGLVVIARGGTHLTIGSASGLAVARLDHALLRATYTPSVDHLFEAAARQYGAGVLGVVLTGMGDDGLAGARAITAAGGTVLTESEDSCIIYGMPRCVKEAGLSSGEAELGGMMARIISSL